MSGARESDAGLARRDLDQVEYLIECGAKHREQQRALIAQIERDGAPTVKACRLLRHFEELQLLHVAERDRLIGVIQALERAGTGSRARLNPGKAFP